MSAIRTTSLALAAAMAIAAPVLAQSTMPEYLFQLPERQWVLGGSLTQIGSRCGSDQCEAGYRSGDLVLSVRRGSGSVQTTAAVRGCATVTSRSLPSSTLEPLSLSAKYDAIQRAALLTARSARTQCGSPVADLIDTTALVRVVPGQAY